MKSFAFFKYSLMVLFSALLFTSCQTEDSADVNQDKIYQDYELFYNSNTDKTEVVARFRFGSPTGTLLELKEPASVTFDGETIPFKVGYAGHQMEFSGQLNGGTFLYTNVDGETFENTVPAYESIDFPNGITSVSKSEALTINWDGTPLSEDQAVGLFIGSWKWGEDALVLEGGSGTSGIVVGTDKLSNVAEGSSTFYMDRLTEINVQEGTEEGGKIRGKYRAKNIDVTITE